MKVLGIETSCDETSASVVENGRYILSNIIASQDHIHGKFGGVVPELASRRHIEVIGEVVLKALDSAKTIFDEIGLIAVTQGPGLPGSLVIGISFAQALSYRYSIPILGVNHIEGHIISAIINKDDVKYPILGLVVSGGHTMLVKMDAMGSYSLIGQTLDDAAGESFDKVAMMMGLGYPGGPLISKLASSGNPNEIRFPRAIIKNKPFHFSFSGLKTAVLYRIKSEQHPMPDQRKADIAASFEEAAVDVLVKKTIKAAYKHNTPSITLGGGVARNALLRKRLSEQAAKYSYKFYQPEPELCTDNAAMIAALGYFYRNQSDLSINRPIDSKPNMQLTF